MIELSDATKEQLNAPFELLYDGEAEMLEVYDRFRDRIAVIDDDEQGKRIALLPELYDALKEAAAGKCWSCAAENTETMLDNPCPKGHDEDCYVAKWRELLRKVRDGK